MSLRTMSGQPSYGRASVANRLKVRGQTKKDSILRRVGCK